MSATSAACILMRMLRWSRTAACIRCNGTPPTAPAPRSGGNAPRRTGTRLRRAGAGRRVCPWQFLLVRGGGDQARTGFSPLPLAGRGGAHFIVVNVPDGRLIVANTTILFRAASALPSWRTATAAGFCFCVVSACLGLLATACRAAGFDGAGRAFGTAAAADFCCFVIFAGIGGRRLTTALRAAGFDGAGLEFRTDAAAGFGRCVILAFKKGLLRANRICRCGKYDKTPAQQRNQCAE